MNRPTRGCGKCYACCKTYSIEALDKPPDKLCEHCKPGRKACQIYKKRPTPCRTFKCFWLNTPGAPENLRPDRLGVVIEAFTGPHINNIKIVIYTEFIFGRLESSRVLAEAKKALSSGWYVLFMKPFDLSIKIFVPPINRLEDTKTLFAEYTEAIRGDLSEVGL